jgi:hypothetical protein
MSKRWFWQKKQTDIEYLNSHIDSLVQTVPLMVKSIINMLPVGKREDFVNDINCILNGQEQDNFIEQKNQNLKDKNYGHDTDTSVNILKSLGSTLKSS